MASNIALFATKLYNEVKQPSAGKPTKTFEIANIKHYTQPKMMAVENGRKQLRIRKVQTAL
ncbi:hypothetical protein [Stenotrophomonas maltophilia]|uniref:hypothetical protein n=1 Tax=Stenotrophomonas maltophilia TaxID=40324 RepID=UPI0034E23A32